MKKHFRKINKQDKCCQVKSNLNPAKDLDGSKIDGGWVCKECEKLWIGSNMEDLSIITEAGDLFLKGIDIVVRKGENIRLANVLYEIKQNYPDRFYILI